MFRSSKHEVHTIEVNKVALNREKLPSILKMDSKVSERLYRMLCIKAEKKVKIIEEIYQKGENEETVMAEI